MFNVGGGEIVAIALLALLVLGPERLPDAARRVAKVVAQLRRVSSGFQEELRATLEEPASSDGESRGVDGDSKGPE